MPEAGKRKKRKGTGMKGLTIKGGHKRPTKAGAGLTAKGVAKYRRQKQQKEENHFVQDQRDK